MDSLEIPKRVDRVAFKEDYLKTCEYGKPIDPNINVKFVVDALEEHPDDAHQILGILNSIWEEMLAEENTSANPSFQRWERDAIIVELAGRRKIANVNLPQPSPKAVTDTHGDVTATLGDLR